MTPASKIYPALTLDVMLSRKEGQYYDVKSAQKKPSEMADIVSAYANAEGGTVVIGISDKTRKVEGVNAQGEDKINDFLNLPKDCCVPMPEYRHEFVDITNDAGKPDRLILLHIKPSVDKVISTTKDEVYLRIGDKSRKLSVEEIRQWGLRGDYILVAKYDDRLEIKSPGRLPNIVTVDNIFTTRFARNPVISRVLTEMELVRELNEGVPRVFKEMQEAGLPEPKIVETAANVTVVLYNGKTVSSSDNPSDTRLSENLSANLSVTQQKILKMIEGRTYTNASNAAELLHISRNSVNAAISVLKEKGLIERIGEDKGGHWEIVKK